MKPYSLLILSLAIVSCAPPYSAELNSSAGLARQMTLLGTFGPIKSPDGNETTEMKFLPLKPTSATTSIDSLGVGSGFLVSRSTGRESLCFAFQESGGNIRIADFRQGFSLAGADPNFPMNEYDVIETTTTANIVAFHLDGTASGGTYQLLTADLAAGTFTPAGQILLNSVYGSQTAAGVQCLPLVAAPYDRFNFLFTSGSSWSEIDASLSGSSFGTGAIYRTATLPAGINRMLYYRSADNVWSYFGYNSGGNWIWSRTDGSSTFPLNGVTHRIDAVLSNGDLISTEDATLRIYDSGGAEKLSVGLGALQFCYEAYVGTTPYVFFSLSLDFPREAWAFRAYAIPTAKLRGLEG
jgi:hypothetical protein